MMAQNIDFHQNYHDLVLMNESTNFYFDSVQICYKILLDSRLAHISTSLKRLKEELCSKLLDVVTLTFLNFRS
jgi:hypothetical protein